MLSHNIQGKRHGISGDKLRDKVFGQWNVGLEVGYDFESVFMEGKVDAYFSGTSF